MPGGPSPCSPDRNPVASPTSSELGDCPPAHIRFAAVRELAGGVLEELPPRPSPRPAARTVCQRSPDTEDEGREDKRPRQDLDPSVDDFCLLVGTPSPASQTSDQEGSMASIQNDDEYERHRRSPTPPASQWSRPSTSRGTDSTSYATIAPVTSTPPAITYAALAAMPAARSPTPTTPPPDKLRTTQRPRGYPPIVVERLPNWTDHFKALTKKLGHAPHARPYNTGVRFIPRTPDEYRTVQQYMREAEKKDPAITWYCYSPVTERPTKVAIRGLPHDTPPEEIKAALEERGFYTTHVRAIPSRRGRPGCLFHVQLEHLDQQELTRLYAVDELLYMPGVIIEIWKGRGGPPQCHRCQAFGHASANCHRPLKCVRCGGEHIARDCDRPRDQPATCANCAKQHPANDRRCPVFRREARKRGIKVAPSMPVAKPPQQTPAPIPISVEMPEKPSGATLAPLANGPTERGQPLKQTSRRRRRRRGRNKRAEEPAAASTPTANSQANKGRTPIALPPEPTKRMQQAPQLPDYNRAQNSARVPNHPTPEPKPAVPEPQRAAPQPRPRRCTPVPQRTTQLPQQTLQNDNISRSEMCSVLTHIMTEIAAGANPMMALARGLAWLSGCYIQ